MRFKHIALIRILAALMVVTSQAGGAGVPVSEAMRLKAELTPLGGQRSGSSDGRIPPWQGGYTKVWPGYRSGQPRPDPFADEKPVFRVTAQNLAQYAGQLSEGVKALLQ